MDELPIGGGPPQLTMRGCVRVVTANTDPGGSARGLAPRHRSGSWERLKDGKDQQLLGKNYSTADRMHVRPHVGRIFRGGPANVPPAPGLKDPALEFLHLSLSVNNILTDRRDRGTLCASLAQEGCHARRGSQGCASGRL